MYCVRDVSSGNMIYDSAFLLAVIFGGDFYLSQS